MDAKWVEYESDKGDKHPALLYGPVDAAKADLLVFDKDTGAPTWQRDVPRRAEGGGDTFK